MDKRIRHDVLQQEISVKAQLVIVPYAMGQLAIGIDVTCQNEVIVFVGRVRLQETLADATGTGEKIQECNCFLSSKEFLLLGHIIELNSVKQSFI